MRTRVGSNSSTAIAGASEGDPTAVAVSPGRGGGVGGAADEAFAVGGASDDESHDDSGCGCGKELDIRKYMK